MASTPFLGAIFMFAGNFAPRGYALCQGQLLSISTNTALFSILGTTYGGNGTTTFALPDLRGRAPVGTGQGPGLTNISLGELAGVENVTILTSNMPPHTHLLGCDSNGGNTANLSPVNGVIGTQLNAQGGGVGPIYSPGPVNATMAPTSISLTGGGIPISVQSPYLGINFIIALQGIFPSRN